MRYLVVFGARPSAVKLAPVIHALQARGAIVHISLTGQHDTMLEEVMRDLMLVATYRHERNHDSQTAALGKMIADVGRDLVTEAYHCCIVVGDTMSGLAGALAAYALGIRVAHVEAGLRTFEKEPHPEEGYRRMIDQMATWLFTPTERATMNAIGEVGAVPFQEIQRVGNTCIDSMLKAGAVRCRNMRKSVLITLHRSENLEHTPAIVEQLLRLADEFPTVNFLWPAHPKLRLNRLNPINIVDPMGYHKFLKHLCGAHLVVTDSGGVQEEAGFLGVPALIVRQCTERPETIGTSARLVDWRNLYAEIKLRLDKPELLGEMERPTEAFGTGGAGQRIAEVLEDPTWQ